LATGGLKDRGELLARPAARYGVAGCLESVLLARSSRAELGSLTLLFATFFAACLPGS
jgi:hypothetical protein